MSGRQGQPSRQQNNIRGGNRQGGARGGAHKSLPRPLPPIPSEEEIKKMALKGVNAKKFPSKNGSDQKSKATEKQKEDISKELQALARELNITDGSPQEIIEAACGEIRNSKETTTKDQTKGKANELEELKKVVFSVNTVKEKEHDIEKAKAKIQDLHRCQEDLTVIKTAVMNPNKSKDFKPTQSTEEVLERINALHGRANEVESNLEELQKVVFSVTKVKDKEHDIEKTKTKIQDLHRWQEDLTVIKTAVMNPKNSKDFKPTQSAEEVVERINALHSIQEDLTLVKTAVMNPNKSKNFKLIQSTEEIVERINALHGEILQHLKETTTKDQTKGTGAKNLEELKKVVFSVTKVKDKEHDIEKTKAKIQDLHSCERELTVIKTAVMNPNKSKDFKPTQSAEEVVERIHTLHRIEHDCLELKALIFNKELRKLTLFGELDDNQCTVENANKITEELTSMYKRMEADQKKLCIVILGKNKQHNMEEALNAVQSLKKAADESRNEIQQQKTKLEQMEEEIVKLKDQLTDTRDKYQALLKRNQEREQKLTDELNEVKSQKEKALTRLSEVAGAKLTESNPYITDLSDPNRPEKIGEQFSELYDNLWTDVFEKLCDTCNLSERDSIQTLLQILEDSYGYCKNISSKRYSNTLAELTLWKLVEHNETPLPVPILAKVGLNVTSLSTIKKMLKSSLEGTSVIVQESFWKQRSEDANGRKDVLECTKPFLMKCVHICWLMVGQDPPVYLRFSDKDKDNFNKDVYREYTANGNVLDFVVWPAIFLHENGPLLKKGVAQPISKK